MRISSAIMPAFSFYSHKMPQKTYFTGQDVFVKSASKKEDSKKEDMINTVVSEFQQLEGVEAIGIGGSSASKRTDNSSDVDVYIFTNKDIPISEREKIIKKYSSRHEIGQEYFGAGDEFRVDSTGTEFDVMYFDKKWIEDNYDNVWVKHNASNGYTTCFLYTLSIMDEKFDRTGWLKGMKEKLNTPYPKELQDNIIKRNMMLLKDKPFASYLE